MLHRLIERFVRRYPRGRRIRLRVIGASSMLPCPMLRGLYRPASACQQCEYSLGVLARKRTQRQICGFGVKATWRLPTWLRRLWNALKRFRLPRGYVSAKFQWKRNASRPMSRIQKRHRDRLVRKQQQREARRRLLDRQSKMRHRAQSKPPRGTHKTLVPKR